MGKHFSTGHVFQDHVQIGIVLKLNGRKKINNKKNKKFPTSSTARESKKNGKEMYKRKLNEEFLDSGQLFLHSLCFDSRKFTVLHVLFKSASINNVNA